MQGTILAFAVAIALRPPIAIQSATVDPAKEFQASLAHVRDLVEKGSFERAEKELKELLDRQTCPDHARRARNDVVELARRCAFERSAGTPKLATLVSGELVKYDAHTGDLEIRYSSKQQTDFATLDYGELGKLRLHPAMFLDYFTIEVECPPRLHCGKYGPSLLVGVGTDEEFKVSFGYDWGDSYYPARIVRVKGEDGSVVEEKKQPPSYDKKSELKVVVGAGSVTAFRDGKRILQTKRTVRESGKVGLLDLADFDRLTLKGKVQPAWAQGLLDAATRAALAKFDEQWKPASALPAWLFEGTTAPAASPPADAAGSGGAPKGSSTNDASKKGREPSLDPAFKRRLDEVAELVGKRKAAAIEEEWKKLVAQFSHEPLARYELACWQLRMGKLDDAQATSDAAVAAGMTPEALHSLPKVVLQARNGPEWRKVFSHTTDHYVVKSDIDEAVCTESCKLLEEWYRSYRIRLAPAPDDEKRKFTVFVFSGKAGYGDYAKATLGAKLENTSGVYSPTLKQLLIWNVPDRAEMYRTVRHEGFHQYLDRFDDDAPLWFNEGSAVYFEVAEFYGGEWKEGQVHRGYTAMLQQPEFRWVPLATLFAMDHRTFQGERIGDHYAQSWAVVHYLRTGPRDAQELYRRFFAAITHGKTAEETTKEVFAGVDLGALGEAVKSHVDDL